MNKIRSIQALTKKEIEQGISTGASWHTDFRDTAFIYFGGLPYELSEGDVITIFSQYGEPVFLKLARDKDTGKSKGFGWLKFEDQRSTDLAVDNLGGSEIGGRLISVDHARYKARDDEDPDEFRVGWEDMRRKEGRPVSEDESSEEEVVQKRRPLLPEEQQLAKLMQDHDEDPMKAYLIEEKKKEIEEAKRKAEKRESRSKHRHHRSHRSGRDEREPHRTVRSRERDHSRDRRQRDEEKDSREPRRDPRAPVRREYERREYGTGSGDDVDEKRRRRGDRHSEKRKHAPESPPERQYRGYRDDRDKRSRARSRSPRRHDGYSGARVK